MSFVPVVTTSNPPPSPGTMELAERLVGTVEEHMASHPGTRPEEVRQALRLAESRFGTSLGPQLVALVLGILLAAGAAVFMVAQRGSFEFDGSVPVVLIALVILALLGVFVALKR